MARQRRSNAQPAVEKEQRRKKEKSSRAKTTIAIIIVVIVVVALAVTAGLLGIKKFLGTAQTSTAVSLDTEIGEEYRVESGSEKSSNESKGPRDGAIDYLLVGADSRVDMQGNPLSEELAAQLRTGSVETTNTDVIMLLRVAADGSGAHLVSIPRDTYITDREFGKTKINGVYAMHQAPVLDSGASGDPSTQKRAADAGRVGLAEAVGSLTGVTIDHYVEIGLVGFALFTDAVGGVDVCLNQPTEDPMTGASFPAGQQTLDGANALSFVRQRYGLANGDLDRVKRQQAYLSSMSKKLLSAGTLSDPGKLKKLLDGVEKAVAVDDNLSLTDTAGTLSKIDPAKITFETIPVVTISGVGENGESVVEVDIPQVQTFFAARAGSVKFDNKTDDGTDDLGQDAKAPLPQDMEMVTSVTSARVFSAGGEIGPARDAAKRLADDGVVVTDIAMVPSQWAGAGAQVLVKSQTQSAQHIADMLGLPLVYESSLPEGMVVVIVGAEASTESPGTAGGVEEVEAPPAPAADMSDSITASEGVVCVN